MCTHAWHTPPPLYATPPAAQFVGVGDHLLQSREETHLEVSVDDPHLVTMENSLQDLLDTVTVQTAGRLVEWSWGGRGGGGGSNRRCGKGRGTGVQPPAWASKENEGNHGGRRGWPQGSPSSAPRSALLVLALPPMLDPGLLRNQNQIPSSNSEGKHSGFSLALLRLN